MQRILTWFLKGCFFQEVNGKTTSSNKDIFAFSVTFLLPARCSCRHKQIACSLSHRCNFWGGWGWMVLLHTSCFPVKAETIPPALLFTEPKSKGACYVGKGYSLFWACCVTQAWPEAHPVTSSLGSESQCQLFRLERPRSSICNQHLTAREPTLTNPHFLLSHTLVQLINFIFLWFVCRQQKTI